MTQKEEMGVLVVPEQLSLITCADGEYNNIYSSHIEELNERLKHVEKMLNQLYYPMRTTK